MSSVNNAFMTPVYNRNHSTVTDLSDGSHNLIMGICWSLVKVSFSAGVNKSAPIYNSYYTGNAPTHHKHFIANIQSTVNGNLYISYFCYSRNVLSHFIQPGLGRVSHLWFINVEE